MKNIAIVLGYRLNNDSSCAEELIMRLKTFLKLDKEINIDKVIVSGGMANAHANISEAQAMANYLISVGYQADKIVKEESSFDTEANARYSLPLAIAEGATTIYLVSSEYHFTRTLWNAKKIFENELKRLNANIELIIYSDKNLYN